MRKESTDAERKLWTILRARSLGGYKFRRQHPEAGYILDFHCAARRLAVELDGGQHMDAEAVRYDQSRTNVLRQAGVRVLRFPNDQVLRDPDQVAEQILWALEEVPSP